MHNFDKVIYCGFTSVRHLTEEAICGRTVVFTATIPQNTPKGDFRLSYDLGIRLYPDGTDWLVERVESEFSKRFDTLNDAKDCVKALAGSEFDTRKDAPICHPMSTTTGKETMTFNLSELN